MSDDFNSMFFSEDVVSPLGRALKNNDEKFIDEYLKQYDTKKDSDLFKVLDQLTITRNLDFDVQDVKYNKYIINDMLSRSFDSIGHVFIMNLISDGLSDQQHYDYLVRNIPGGRKNYTDGTRKYMNENAYDSLVKILICHVYKCRVDIADDYYDVLKARNKVDEFINQYKGFLTTPEADEASKKVLKHKDSRKEYNNLVSEILGD